MHHSIEIIPNRRRLFKLLLSIAWWRSDEIGIRTYCWRLLISINDGIILHSLTQFALLLLLLSLNLLHLLKLLSNRLLRIIICLLFVAIIRCCCWWGQWYIRILLRWDVLSKLVLRNLWWGCLGSGFRSRILGSNIFCISCCTCDASCNGNTAKIIWFWNGGYSRLCDCFRRLDIYYSGKGMCISKSTAFSCQLFSWSQCIFRIINIGIICYSWDCNHSSGGYRLLSLSRLLQLLLLDITNLIILFEF